MSWNSKLSPNKRSLVTALAIFIIGMLISYAIYFSMVESKRSQSIATFEHEAKLRAKDIEAELKRSFFQIASVGNLFSSSNWVSHQEFLGFVERVFPEFPQGRRLSIIAHFDEAEQLGFIEQMGENPEPYFDNFGLFDYYQQQKSVPPTISNGVMTILQYSYPVAPSLNFYGRNITPRSPIYPRLQPVIQSKKPFISGINGAIKPITLKPFILYLYPIVKADSQGNEKLEGVVTSSQYVEDLFGSNAIGQSLDLYEYVLVDNVGKQFVFPQSDFSDNKEIGLLNGNEIRFTQTFEINGNNWQLVVLPKYAMLDASSTLLNSIWLLGAIISFLLALVSHLVMSQQLQLSKQVESKTLELNQSLAKVNEHKQQLTVQNFQLEQAVDKATKAAQVKAEFLANMSHEIRTPLNGITGFTEILKNTPLNVEQLEYIDKMEFSAKHLRTVINDILDFSKIESSEIQLEQAPISIFSIIDYLEMSFKESCKQKGITFDVVLRSDSHPDLIGDLVRVNQVLLNLCSNAVKFTDKGGVTVSISMEALSSDEEQLLITFEVADTGIGLNANAVDALFQAFTQADTSTTRKFGGTGLGLAISQKLCKLMDGEITVSSEEEVGSVFTATMTLGINNNVLLDDDSRLQFEQPFNILIIDDNSMSLTVLADRLIAMNAIPTKVNSAEDGLALITESPDVFSVILLDWTMPEINGQQFIERLSQMNLKLLPHIVVITAYDMSLIRSTNTALSIDGVLQKPCSPTQLFEMINSALEQDKALAHGVVIESPSFEELNVLVVEDNKINQTIIRKLLSNEGINSVIAGNGEECLARLEQQDFDLVLMDIQMPIMDGVEATKRIRSHQDERVAKLPIIALTANVMVQDVESYLAVGMNSHIPKPIELEVLKQELAKALRQTSLSASH